MWCALLVESTRVTEHALGARRAIAMVMVPSRQSIPDAQASEKTEYGRKHDTGRAALGRTLTRGASARNSFN